MAPLPNATPPPTSEHQIHQAGGAPISTITTPNIGSTPIGGPPRHGEYLVLLPTNPRQPGVQSITGYRPIQMNQFNQQGQLIRPIMLPNNAQIIRTQAASSSGVMPTQTTSQSPVTTMANIQNRQLPIMGAAGATGPRQMYNGPIMSNQLQRAATIAPRANILQSPGMMRNFAQQSMGVHSIMSNNQGLGIRVPTSIATQQPTIIHHANTASPVIAPPQMTAEIALEKGKIFFTQLLTNNSIQNKQSTLTSLIQSLIDGKITSEEFATNLQRELNSPKPQDKLGSFLNLLLPPLRQSMINGQTTLPGIRAPNQALPPPMTIIRSDVESPIPSTSSDNQSQSPLAGIASQPKKKVLPAGQKTPYAIKKEAREARKREKEASQTNIDKLDASKDLDIKPKIEKKQQKQKKQLESLSASTLRDDDDVNDVAAMGGVNLAEESQKIMASGAELVGTQIRSCKDEPFFDMDVLTSKITRITKEKELADPAPEIAILISHATQEMLKTMVERLGILADHRCENLRFNPKYEVTTDIKGQVKFLAELDRIERRKIEEQERKQMAQIAKSRSKVEDPEQQKLRQKAKDMQRAEQEEVRQREANETARLAIGSRKKLKTSFSPSESSFSQSSGGGSLGETKPIIDFRTDNVRRTRRVNIRDLQTLLELDRTHLDTLIKLTAC